MLRKLKQISQTIKLIAKGFDPVYFVNSADELTTTGSIWRIDGEDDNLSAQVKEAGESWAPIRLKNNLYFVSDKANVRNRKGDKVEPITNGKRYSVLLETKDVNGNKKKMVSRAVLVACAFHKHTLGSGKEVHHLNLNRTDDRPENLAVLTHEEHVSIHRKIEKRSKAEDVGTVKKKAHSSGKSTGLTKPLPKTPPENPAAVTQSVRQDPREIETKKSTFVAPPKGNTPYRQALIEALKRFQVAKLDPEMSVINLKPVYKSKAKMLKTSNPIQIFDEMLYTYRALACFQEQCPKKYKNTYIKELEKNCFTSFKEAVRQIKKGRDTDKLTYQSAKELLKRESNNTMHKNSQRQSYLVKLYNLL